MIVGVRRIIRLRLRGESGYSLIEMAAVLLILSLVMLFTFQSFGSMQFTATGAGRRLENLDEARVLMGVLTKDVRTATRIGVTGTPFVLADDNEVVFYANLNLSTACPTRVRIFVDATGQLVEEVTQPDAGGIPGGSPPCAYSAAPATRLVGRYIVNTATQPIFTYWYPDAMGTLVSYSSAQTPLADSESQLITNVGIRLSIREDTQLQVPPTTVVNQVRLPNVYYNPLPSPSP